MARVAAAATPLRKVCRECGAEFELVTNVGKTRHVCYDCRPYRPNQGKPKPVTPDEVAARRKAKLERAERERRDRMRSRLASSEWRCTCGGDYLTFPLDHVCEHAEQTAAQTRLAVDG